MKRKIIQTIIFSIVYILLSFIFIFYLDLANGPLYIFIIELALIIILIGLRILFHKRAFFIRNMPIWALLSINFILLPLAKPIVESKSAVNFKNPEKTEILNLKDGKVQGVYNKDKSVEVYAGIPYAKAPIGNLRWKEPQDVEQWTDVKDCSTFAPKSMQPKSNPVMDSLVDIYAMKGWNPNFNMNPIQNMSEDSLYLNIWRPSGNKTNLPIYVYIHGGSLTSGSAASDDTNGEMMAKNDVIMITVAYRLGVFGYFALQELIDESPNHTTGNYGLLDQIKALKWINDNASYFGGNKDNITIAGESAGSSSISAICSSPLAKGLFKRAVGESSSIVHVNPPHTFRSLETAIETGNKIMKEQNVTTLEQLRNIPAEKLVTTQYSNSSMTLDGYALTKMPLDVYKGHENNEETLLNGYNVKEADAFVVPTYLTSPTNKENIKSRLENYFGKDTASKIYELYKEKIDKDAFSAFNEIISVFWFIYPHETWTRAALDAGVNVYRYQFTKDNGYYGTYHSGEIIYF